MGRLRRRATIARKGIVEFLETAAEYGFTDKAWQTLASDMMALTRALRDVERLEEMEAGVTSLERQQIGARERLEQLLGAVDSDPKGAENRPHYNNYQTDIYPEQDIVIASKESSREAGEAIPLTSRTGAAETGGTGDRGGDRTGRAGAVRTELNPDLRSPRPTWSDIVDAADYLRGDLGVSKSLWVEACGIMNRYRAAVALAIVSTSSRNTSGAPGRLFPRHGRQGQSQGIAPRHARSGPGAAPHSLTPCGAGEGQRLERFPYEFGKHVACG